MLISEIINSLLMIFIMIIPGVVFRKFNVINSKQNEAVTSILVNLLWPCLIINAMQITRTRQILLDSGYMLVLAAVVFVLVLAIAIPFCKLIRLSKSKQYITMFMLLFGNTGFIGIPVVKALYGTDSLFYAAIIEMINDVLIFTVGIILVQLSAKADLKIKPKDMVSPGLISIFIGLALFLAGIELPGIIGGSIEMIGNATSPLAMFTIGYQLGALTIKQIFGEWRFYIVSAAMLLLVPAIALGVVMIVANEISLMHKVLVLSFAMPAASVSAIFSQQYKGEVEYATPLVLISTVLSVLTIPVFAIFLEFV